MDQQQMIAETNQLLRRVLELEEERKVQAAKDRVEYERHKEEFEAMTRGREEDDFEAKLEKRFEENRRKSDERIEILRAKDQEYKQQLLGELATQSELLRKIAEKLGR